ncbi:hypothetical protein [Flagellimonas sp.]|uniref:hypothetical protein n=1 Tax=Flagellimonas sp. TaxID=2058762 RepID=UPI003B5137D1
MKGRKILVSFLVVIAILGYVGCSIYLFKFSFSILDDSGKLPENFAEEMNSSLAYITTGLTGLVGSIVAIAFGVQAPKPLAPPGAAAVPEMKKQTQPFNNINFQHLGSFIQPTKGLPAQADIVDKKNKNDRQGVFGFIYALAYILIGLSAIVIWIINEDQTIESVSHMATSFFGMMIPIVAGFFSNNKQ